jgi:hypothetical protein
MSDIAQMPDGVLAAAVYEALGWGYQPGGINPTTAALVRKAMVDAGWCYMSTEYPAEIGQKQLRNAGFWKGEGQANHFNRIGVATVERATFEAALMALRASQCSE